MLPDGGTMSRSDCGHVQMIPAPIAAPTMARFMSAVPTVGAVVNAEAKTDAAPIGAFGSSDWPRVLLAPPTPWAVARISPAPVAVAAPEEDADFLDQKSAGGRVAQLDVDGTCGWCGGDADGGLVAVGHE